MVINWKLFSLKIVKTMEKRFSEYLHSYQVINDYIDNIDLSFPHEVFFECT